MVSRSRGASGRIDRWRILKVLKIVFAPFIADPLIKIAVNVKNAEGIVLQLSNTMSPPLGIQLQPADLSGVFVRISGPISRGRSSPRGKFPLGFRGEAVPGCRDDRDYAILYRERRLQIL